MNKQINEYISASQSMNASSKGTNKKCYIFDDVVLLSGLFGEDESQIKEKIDSLKDSGVNICRILEIVTIDNKNYELQERAEGEELYQLKLDRTHEGQLKFLEVLDSLSRQDISFYEKFLTDWKKILDAGLVIDPSKSTNFLYDGKNITFIDLGINEDYQEKAKLWMLIHAAVVLRGGGLLWQCKDVYEEAKEKVKIIYQKIGKVGLEMGESIDDYISYLDPHDEYGLKDYFSVSKIGSSRK